MPNKAKINADTSWGHYLVKKGKAAAAAAAQLMSQEVSLAGNFEKNIAKIRKDYSEASYDWGPGHEEFDVVLPAMDAIIKTRSDFSNIKKYLKPSSPKSEGISEDDLKIDEKRVLAQQAVKNVMENPHVKNTLAVIESTIPAIEKYLPYLKKTYASLEPFVKELRKDNQTGIQSTFFIQAILSLIETTSHEVGTEMYASERELPCYKKMYASLVKFVEEVKRKDEKDRKAYGKYYAVPLPRD